MLTRFLARERETPHALKLIHPGGETPFPSCHRVLKVSQLDVICPVPQLPTQQTFTHCATLARPHHVQQALHRENEIGTLEAGKLADLIVLSADPLSTDPYALTDIDVLLTIVGGELAWRSSNF